MDDVQSFDSDQTLENDVEDAPLLGERSSRRGFQSLFTRPMPASAVFLYVCFFLALELGQSLPANSSIQVVEEILCREMRGAADCGADDSVQGSLAILMGWYHTFMILPGFWPEKFSIHKLWATQLLFFIGGGLPVTNAILFANITGLTTDASRSSIFSFIIALSLGPRLIATVAASRLMELHGPWLILWLSQGFMILSCFLSLFIIEPKKNNKHSDESATNDGNAYSSLDHPNAAPTSGGLKDQILRSIQEAKAGATFIMKKSSSFTVRIIACLIFMTLAWQCSGVSEQLMRRRFGWSWAKLSYVSALEITVSLISCMVLLPAVSFISSSKYSISTTTRDLAVARACGVVFILGAIITVLTPNSFGMLFGVVLFNLGTVYNQVLKTLLVVVVGENSVVLFSGLNILETIGNLASAPLVAQAFRFGLRLGGMWMALPVMLGAGFAGMGLLILGLRNGRVQLNLLKRVLG